ncbi:MAG: SAM-dependent methyltransferase [Chthoniobacter sp.]|nr:SAM-dependent methyltransferase [Chthoniobacter sp.]
MARPKSNGSSTAGTATIGFEAKLWLTADSRSEAETASRRLPAGRAQRGNLVESHGGTAMRDSAKPNSEASLREFCEAKHHRGDISIYGQDKWARRQRPFGLATRARRVRLRRQQPKQSNATTRRLAIMNLAIRGIEAAIGKEHAATFRNVQHPDLRADYVLAKTFSNN